MKNSHLKCFLHLLAPYVAFLVWLWSRTLRIRWSSEEAQTFLDNRPLSKAVFIIWHDRILSMVGPFCFYDIGALVSGSPEGRLVAKISNYLGYRAIHGSSTRGGAKALLYMLKQEAHNPCYVIAVDGPSGPAHQVKPGALFLAKALQRPIYPLSCQLTSYWRLNSSWDRHYIPKPFSTVMITLGEPLDASKKMSAQELMQKLEAIS